MIQEIRTTTTARLAASFGVIILLLIAVALYANFFIRQTDRLHRDTINYILARRQYVHMMQGEFNYFRYLLRDSYFSTWWINASDTETRLHFEQLLTESYNRMITMADAHLALVYADPLISKERAEIAINYMVILRETINRIFAQFYDNFFIGSSQSYDVGDVLSYIAYLNYIFDIARDLVEMSTAEIHRETDLIIANTMTATIIVVLFTVLVAVALAYLMVKSFASTMEKIQTKEREAARRMRSMLDATPTIITYWSRDYKCTDANQATLEFFGSLSIKDFLDFQYELMTAYHASPSDTWKKWVAHLSRAFETGHDVYTYDDYSGRGEKTTFVSHAYRITVDDNYVVVNYGTDITARRQVEEEKQKSAIAEENSLAKSRFLARMSHEIRTPLTAVLGISEIQLQNPNLPLSVEEAFAKVHNSANILLGLVNDILDLSRIESGKLTIMDDPYELSSLIIDVVQLHMVYLGSKKIDFRVSADEHLPTHLIGDELRIRQILNNLLSNAFKYTDSGSVELAMERLPGPTEDTITLKILIRDTGYGMTAEQLQMIKTEEYNRFHEREDKTAMGTGLGMSIVFNLLKSMNATIDIESVVGMGTCFILKIPQGIDSTQVLGAEAAANLINVDSIATSMAKRTKFTPEPMPYGKVLVVDDIDTNLYVARGLLMFYDLQIETCISGIEAIQKVKKGSNYDIIFMDHMMPEMNGMEATQALREIGYTLPIVALTANALIGQAELFLSSGFDGFLSKPIQTVHLNGILNKYVRDKQSQEVLEAARIKSENTRIKPGSSYYPQIESFMEHELDNLRRDFVRGQKNTASNLRTAIETSDFEAAHRLVHTLKGLAGLIYENQLSSLAARAERQLHNQEIPRLDELEKELTAVLEKIVKSGVMEEPDDLVISEIPQAAQSTLFDKLQANLDESDAVCLELIPELKQIPETKVLVRQIEDFNFESALVTLTTLRTVLEV